MIRILKCAGHSGNISRPICETIVNNCQVCKKTSLPASARKVSLSHIFQAFNEEIQCDFVFVNIRSCKYCVLHVVDFGSGYSGTSIASHRSTELMASLLETIWIHRRGSLRSFSADTEFKRGTMEKVLSGLNIKLNISPDRRHSQTGIVEGKNRTISQLWKDFNLISHKSLARHCYREPRFCPIFSSTSCIQVPLNWLEATSHRYWNRFN